MIKALNEEAAKNLHKNLKRNIKDEFIITKEACMHSKMQRQDIKQAYIGLYATKLEDDAKSTLQGSFLKLLLALFQPTLEYESHCLKEALKDYSTNTRSLRVIIQILCTKKSDEIKELDEVFARIFNHDIVREIAKHEHGEIGKFFKIIASGNRENIRGSEKGVEADVNSLINAQAVKGGTINELVFIEILSKRSFAYLNSIFEVFEKKTENTIENVINKKLNASLEAAMIGIIKSARNLHAFLAQEIHSAIKNYKTCEEELTRLLVIRAEIDLAEIKHEFKRMYQREMYEALKNEIISEDEKYLLLLVGND